MKSMTHNEFEVQELLTKPSREKAIQVLGMLLKAGYSREAAVKVIKDTYLIDLDNTGKAGN